MRINKILILLISAILMINSFGCSKQNMKNKASDKGYLEIIQTLEENENETSSIYGDVYITALDSFIPIDSALNQDMEYIAINTQTLINATDQDIIKIMEYFTKYDVDVIDESYESLEEKGMVKGCGELAGILLEIENIEFISKDEIVVEGHKYRTCIGAVGVKSEIVKNNGKWDLESSQITWIS